MEGPHGPAFGDKMGIKTLEDILILEMIPQGWNGERQGMRQYHVTRLVQRGDGVEHLRSSNYMIYNGQAGGGTNMSRQQQRSEIYGNLQKGQRSAGVI